MGFGTLGTLAVWVAVAGAGSTVAASVARRGRTIGLALSATAVAAAAATLVLVVALINRDYSLAYVADTTNSATPVAYRIAALWGGAQGSLLLFATMLAVVAAVGWRQLSRSLNLAAAVMAAVAGLMFLGLATLGSPFSQLAVPAVDGRGMVAILRHPAMLVHPLLLYLGHTMLLVPFAAAFAATLTGDQAGSWGRIANRWLVGAWIALTLGMTGGAMWAYVELGWGGFWAWDSVENSALLPWLAITAYLHLPAQSSERGRPAAGALAMLPFVLTTLGVYVTRSGLTGSVHAFANASSVAWFSLGLFLALLVAAVGAAIIGFRRSRTQPDNAGDRWRGLGLVLLGWSLVVVAVGTAYPLLIRSEGSGVTVAPRWFVAMLIPAALAALAGLSIAADVLWSWRVRGTVFVALTVSALGVGAAAGSVHLVPLLVAAPAAVTALLLVGSLVLTRSVAAVAHLGFALLLLGAAGSAFGAEFHGGVSAGDVVTVGGQDLAIRNIETGSRSDHDYVAVSIALGEGKSSSVLAPEWRGYTGSSLPTSEPAFRVGLFSDYVAAISRVSEDAAVVWLDVFVRPMMIWVWVGGALIAISGLIGLATKAGSAATQHQSATAAPR